MEKVACCELTALRRLGAGGGGGGRGRVGGVLLEAESRATGGENSADRVEGKEGKRETQLSVEISCGKLLCLRAELPYGTPQGSPAGLAAPSQMPGREISCHTAAPPCTNMRFLGEGSAVETKHVMPRKHRAGTNTDPQLSAF